MPGHHHRAGGLKQTNKKNKRSKSSKRSFTRAAGGKINRRVPNSQKSLLAQSKADRRHKTQQRRDLKREELLRRKRGVSGVLPPSRVIGIISLGSTELIEEKLRSTILTGADRTEKSLGNNSNATVTAKFDVHKKDGLLTILTNSTAFRDVYGTDEASAVLAALDLCRVCDMIVFVIDSDQSKLDHDLIDMQIGADEASVKTNQTFQKQNWDHLISERGDRILNAVKAQGMPSILTVLARTESPESARADDFMSVRSAKSVRRSETKRSLNLKKYASRFATTEFGPDNDKVVEIDLSDVPDEDASAMGECEMLPEKRTDAAALVRTLCTKAATPSKWVSLSPRPYLLSDSHKYDSEKQELYITGYLRGLAPFSVNSLVHIPSMGTFACKSLQKSDLPFSRVKTMSDASDVVEADPSQQESLEMFATPDSLEGEQNLVGFDEDVLDADEEHDGSPSQAKPGFSRPAGWSDYQSAWLDAVDDIGAEEGAIDHGELAKELNKGSNKDSVSLAPISMDLDDANDISPEERRLLMEQRRKEQSEHQQFPDEVDVGEDTNARDRFARYRSLKSFRKTYWDPKENLPENYGSVYHFASFKATQRSVMQDLADAVQSAADLGGSMWGSGNPSKQEQSDDADMGDESEDEDILDGCVPSGSYVTLTVKGVNQDAVEFLAHNNLITAVALLPHENKVSVLHAGLSHSMGCDVVDDVPVKSKDVLTFRCGWRTWQARPIFSQHNLNCDKHKFERFMPQKGAFFAASFFGPVTYTPCPVLVFRERKDKPKELVAVGSMIGADAERIVVKRIILTGYPVRVHKRHATVKYMFYNPEDVKWFKPAGLWTKHGLNGNIIESVGEHGTMKCLFNAPIKQHDTVCLPLYKRIFPKFAVGADGQGCDDGVSRATTSRGKTTLVVR